MRVDAILQIAKQLFTKLITISFFWSSPEQNSSRPLVTKLWKPTKLCILTRPTAHLAVLMFGNELICRLTH